MDNWDRHLDDFYYYLSLERSLSKNTLQAYREDCTRVVDYLRKNNILNANEVTLPILEDFVQKLEKVKSRNDEDILLKTASQTRIIQGVRAFFRFLSFSGVLENNPAELLILPKLERLLPETLEREEIKKIISHIDASTLHGFRNKMIIILMYATGLRVSELINLKLSQINFSEQYLNIIGKGNKQRFIPIDAEVLNDLKFYIENYRSEQKISKGFETFVFISEKRGTSLTRQFIFKMLKEYALMAGITKKVHPHILRHSFATELIRGGANLIAVKEMLGHASVTTTEVYINLNTKDLKETLQKYHPIYNQ